MFKWVLNFLAGVIVGAVELFGGVVDYSSVSTPPAADNTDPDIAAQKAKLKDQDQKVVGLMNPRLVTNPSTFTKTKFDTNTYSDRAVITITNPKVSSVTCTGISIQGKAVIQTDGVYQWVYSDYASIERDGEKSIEVSNCFITSGGQTESLGDFIKKEMESHSMYQLYIPGCAYKYEIGDRWHLAISYLINGQASEAENIDVDVDVTSVSFSRNVGSIGETVLDVRVPSGAWSNTTSRRAKYISAGYPEWLANRGDMLIVGSSTHTKQADYYCDGTDDDVEIQAAIDFASTNGDIVQLTAGEFNIGTTIEIKPGVTLQGSGEGTILVMPSTTLFPIVRHDNSAQSEMKDLSVSGKDAAMEAPFVDFMIEGNSKGAETNVVVRDFSFSNTGAGNTDITFFNKLSTATNCVVKDCTFISASNTMIVSGFRECSNVVGCTVSNLDSTSAYCEISVFVISNALAACSVYGNSVKRLVGFFEVRSASSCLVYSNTSSQANAIISGFTNCYDISACSVYSNAVSGSSARIYSYDSCVRLSICNTLNNTSALSSEYGFNNCNSVQQCNSTGDSNPYTSSYADSGTANACADTAAGGYNS